MHFTVLHWNLWLDNQLPTCEDRQNKLIDELKGLLKEYKPDFLSLNEVVKSKESFSVVLDFLKHNGYKYIEYSEDAQINSKLGMGIAFCSKVKPNSTKIVGVSKNPSSEKRGFPGIKKTAILSEINLAKNCKVNLIVTHLMYLRKHSIKDHYDGARKLKSLIENRYCTKNTVVLGDFNQPGFMPRSFKKSTAHILNFKSGTRLNPTWKNKARRLTPIMANLDHLYWAKNSNLTLKDFKIIDSPVSDHRPIVAVFEVAT
jgi:endonuclease/exonuclease/phosphatase family metal-dependent hydrolase